MIAFNCDDNIYELEERDLLLKELMERKAFDVMFLTSASTYNRDFIAKFLADNGRIVDCDEQRLSSDNYGILMRFLCAVSARNHRFDGFSLKKIFHSPSCRFMCG